MSKEKEELNLKENKLEKNNGSNHKKTGKVKKVIKGKSDANVVSKTKKTETKSISVTKKATLEETGKEKDRDITAKKQDNLTKTSPKKDEKMTSSKEINSSKNEKEKSKVTPNEEKVKVKEETIIEKIKSFIAKIVAMQEESKNEELAKKEKKKNTKKTENAEESEEETKTTYLTEYYDLPYRYNETVVKILAQTPKRIFVYWDVADSDRTRYESAFGKDFFEKTYPVLLVHNDDKNYTKEIPINDFANSWYIDIQDPKTKYTIQLGRKFRDYSSLVNIDMQRVQENSIILHTDYLPLANSNV